MQLYNFYMPTRLYFGAGSLNELKTAPLPGRHALICMTAGKSMRRIGALDRITAMLAERGCAYTVYDRIQPNPSRANVMEAAKMARDNGCDFIFGLGGGSAIDCGKAIAVMVRHPGDLWDYIHNGSGGRKPLDRSLVLPLCCVVTTAGTGTEADPGGVVTKDDEPEKLGILDESLFPVFSIIDEELMASVPPKLTAFQGFDALFHGAECYIASIASPISEMFSLEAIRQVAGSLEQAVISGGDLEARAHVALGSTLAGIVQCLSCNTSQHAMEHALSAYHHDVAHGEGLIMLCEAYFSHFARYIPDRLIDMARAMGVSEEEIRTSGAQSFVHALRRLMTACGVDDLKMSDHGILESDIPTLARNAMEMLPGMYALDRAPVTLDDTIRIMRESYR